jgi:hypothetical protein
MHGMTAQVGKSHKIVCARARRHRDYVGQKDIGREKRKHVIVRKIISSRSNEQDAIRHLGRNCVLETLRDLPSTPAIVGYHDIHAAVFHLLYERKTCQGVADIAGAIRGYEFAGKNLNGPVHARNARTVVPSRPNDA